MQRISNEDGFHAAARNIGRYFLFGALPAVLGLGAIWWIAAANGWIDFQAKRDSQQRSAGVVGTVAHMPSIRLVVHDGDCLKGENGSFLSGQNVTFYVRNLCSRWANGASFYYRVKAHDGTVISSYSYAFDGDRDIGPGEKREQVFHIDEDRRTESVEVWTQQSK